MKKYILIVFAKHKDQDLFVRMLSDEILDILGEEEIKYYYGDENIVLTFESPIDFKDIKEFMSLILSEQRIVHFLFPVDLDNIQYYLTQELYDHLFGNTPLNRSGTAFKKDSIDEDNFSIFEENLKDQDKYYNENENLEEMLFFQPIEKEKIPTLDEILDKINDKGISSLSISEQTLLKQYSK
jgi:hypothetical protein